MADKEIPQELVDHVKTRIGPHGCKLFKDYKEKHGTICPTFLRGVVPWPVHLREGMAVRNIMRDLPVCKDWTDHDFDDNWTKVIGKVLDNPFNHLEAFCHMIYECEKCGWIIRVWNSRDGVTPFIGPRCHLFHDFYPDTHRCNGMTQHAMWDQDEYDPDYELQPGDYYWTDYTEEDAKRKVYRTVEDLWDDAEFSMCKMFSCKDAAREKLLVAEMDEVERGAPTLRQKED